MIPEPITETIVKRIRPEVMRLLKELNVTYAEYKDESIVFHYIDLVVTIQVKTKTKKS